MEELNEADELEYLRWFCSNADFGPADGDVRDTLGRAFEEQTKKRVPKFWRREEE